MTDFPYGAPRHLEHLTKFADFGEPAEVTVEVQGKCPECGSERLRFADEYDETSDENVVLCEEGNHWCYQFELDTSDPDNDDQRENDDVEYETDQEDEPRSSKVAAPEDDLAAGDMMDPDISPSWADEDFLGGGGASGPSVLMWDNPQATDKSLVGGKGANLAELQQAGLPVPVGFNIPSYVFESNVPDPEYLRGLILNMQAAEAAEYVRTQVPVPEAEILAAFDQLGVERVAVRSSAIAEDGTEASYAGRQDTFLYQTRDGGQDEPRSPDPDMGLIEAVRNCWASWVDERALDYRKDFGEEALVDLQMAVVVQTMLEPTAGGVGMTEDTGGGGGLMLIRADTITVDAADAPWKVVAGETADVYRLEKASGTVQNIEIYNGGMLQPHHLSQLFEHALYLEETFAGPQDFEWAVENDQVFLLQSRPITT